MESSPEAQPQSREQVARTQRCPEVVDAAKGRGITSIVHFTTVEGLKGILASGGVKSRQGLPEDNLVQYVYEPNAVDRSLDESWLGYVNCSITAINAHMFRFSQRQHPDAAWVILEFGPEILGDGGVVFCTSNNIYPATRRGRGLQGFEQLFAPTVAGRYGQPVARANRSPRETTDLQAEVLYPFELSLEHLHTVTTPDEDVCESAEAAQSHFAAKPKIDLNPEAFR